MARNVEDLALLLSVIAGPSRRAPLSLETPGVGVRAAAARRPGRRTRRALGRPRRRVRRSTTPSPTWSARRPRCSRRTGPSVEDAHPVLHSADAAFRTLRAWLFQHRFRTLLEKRPDGFKPSLRDNILLGADLTGDDVARAYQQLTSIHDRMRAFFETVRRAGPAGEPGAAVQRRRGVPRRHQRRAPGDVPRLDAVGVPHHRHRLPGDLRARGLHARGLAGRASSWSAPPAASGGCSRSRTPSSRPPASVTGDPRSEPAHDPPRSGSASTPAARSPTSWPSTRRPASSRSPRRRRRRATRRSGS